MKLLETSEEIYEIIPSLFLAKKGVQSQFFSENEHGQRK